MQYVCKATKQGVVLSIVLFDSNVSLHIVLLRSWKVIKWLKSMWHRGNDPFEGHVNVYAYYKIYIDVWTSSPGWHT